MQKCYSKVLKHVDMTLILECSRNGQGWSQLFAGECSLQWRHNGYTGVSNHQPQPFIQAQTKENIKAPRHRPLCCGEFTGHRWITAQIASNAENVSIWWRHHVPLYSVVAVKSYLQPLPKCFEFCKKKILIHKLSIQTIQKIFSCTAIFCRLVGGKKRI